MQLVYYAMVARKKKLEKNQKGKTTNHILQIENNKYN